MAPAPGAGPGTGPFPVPHGARWCCRSFNFLLSRGGREAAPQYVTKNKRRHSGTCMLPASFRAEGEWAEGSVLTPVLFCYFFTENLLLLLLYPQKSTLMIIMALCIVWQVITCRMLTAADFFAASFCCTNFRNELGLLEAASY